jgi:hypothetical protein
MVNKNTVINNKNIIQVCCEKPRRKRKTNKGSSGGRSGSNKPINYLKDNAMATQPLNLVNSFPNSTGLEDRRARFIDAMRDPNSTKSPYSIFDNGSNTFAREGNTVGAEQPVQPSISQNDYFQTRQTSFFAPKSILRQPQRIQINTSPINRFEDGMDDDASQASSNYANAWYREQNQEPEFDNEDEDDNEGGNFSYASKSFGIGPAVEESQQGQAEETEDFSHSFLDLKTGPNRFSEPQQETAPFMNSPYRMPEGTEEQEIQPPITIEPNKAEPEEEVDNALIQAQQQVEENRKRKEMV